MLYFYVVLAWCVPLLDLRTPAFVLDGLFDCHCPLTKQNRSINHGNAKNQIRGCWLLSVIRCPRQVFFHNSDFNIETSIVDIGATFVELYGTRFVFFFFPAANTHCRLIGAMNKVRLKKDQTLQKVLIIHRSSLWVCLMEVLGLFLLISP